MPRQKTENPRVGRPAARHRCRQPACGIGHPNQATFGISDATEACKPAMWGRYRYQAAGEAMLLGGESSNLISLTRRSDPCDMNPLEEPSACHA